MKIDVIMSFIFHSHFAMRALDALGSERTIRLVDNSFRGELKGWARRNPHVHYLRLPSNQEATSTLHASRTAMTWHPLCCAASWNLAMQEAETEWIVNVNPDTLMWPQAWRLIEGAIEGRAEGCVLIRSQLNFNIWAGDRASLLALGGFDERFKPCAGEDEDMLVRISKAGLKWQKMNLPAMHMEGGHKDRVDGYRNVQTFVDKWGWKPHSPEYREIVSKGLA